MCEIAKNRRRGYCDQEPPRILEKANPERDASSGEANRSPLRKQQQQRSEESASGTIKVSRTFERDSASSPGRRDASAGPTAGGTSAAHLDQDRTPGELAVGAKVPSLSLPSSAPGNRSTDQVTTNGVKREAANNELLTNGQEMAPVMGVPPPPPAPHMSPDGLILPRKPYNPCLISNNHKDLRRELLFNQKVGKTVLNQKSELQKALEKQRETAMRKEAERNREETYKDDPRTALQKALEHRAKQIQLKEQLQTTEPMNPLMTARARLRPRTDSE